ncbi:S8 family peptidase [Primorskyibacter sp. 2E233]|uniref:S8 family peptidase n=1 Tax=Primorskyibacter sp. 2E233 TaxID=3413431 RepID=UPI003BF1FCC1
MKHRISLLISAAVISAAGLAYAQEATFESQTEPEVVPGQFIVKTSPGTDMARFSIQSLSDGVRVIDTLPEVGMLVIEAPDAEFGALSTRSLNVPGIAYIEPVYVVRADATPNDPDYPQQWAWPKIKAPAAWDIGKDSGNLIVAVVDSGVDYRHPDLAANMWKNPGEIPANGIDDDGNGVIDDVFGANFVGAATNGDPMDDNQHGTHVAGTIGAVTNNSLGVAGVNWKTQIMALKFLSASGSGSTAGAIRAIEYGIKMDADIMNNSWGGGGFSRALEDAIRAADNEGILFVAAAGNSNSNNDTNPHYPSSYNVDNVLAVMATDQSDAKAGFSSFGATSVDMGAPGVGILSTTPGGQYSSFNGTSMATPHVAGAAALVWAQNPGMSHLDIKKHLMDTAEVIPGLAGTSLTGARLDLGKAMKPGDTPPPEPQPEVCKSKAHTQIAYDEFMWSARKQVSKNDNILSVSFTLTEPMVVDISTDTSGHRIEGSGNTLVRTGVYNQANPSVMWTGSYRRMNFAGGKDDYRDISTDFSIVLPKGSHTIYWKLWVTGATLELDSGTLTVRGIPCSMGGKLSISEASTMSADRTEADQGPAARQEELGTDPMGQSTTSSN